MLVHIVEESLAGRADHIKRLTIAQAVFSVGENFDPEVNSIVRVEAGRLRRRLAEYYVTSGSDDPIIVDIPKGSYVPRFTRNPKIDEVGKLAQAIEEKLQRTHPDYPVKQWLNNFIKSEDEMLTIMNQLQLTGHAGN